ncbi:MAG: PhzF family phenazine biosynthesis protein [Rhizobiales bacterium]|nr:PhzF family phenazine biosynthesis protein [Hyphomicrobiales bacterium]
MSRRYAILDVFTSRPLAGNPLAVVLDAEGLDDARMQAIAAEFNLSETVFVLPPERSVHSAAIRIFTRTRELPFAGHPTVGTAILLGLERAAAGMGNGEMVMVLEEKIGPVRCGVSLAGEALGHAIFDLPRLPEAGGPAPDREAIAAALGLMPAEIGFENHRPTVYDAGLAFALVPVRDLGVIARAGVNPAAWQSGIGGAAYLYCRETQESGHHFHARMFSPKLGMEEDPATGSAVAALAGAIAAFDQPPGGSHRYVVEQGFEMGRPSLIGLEIDMDGGAVVEGRISGEAVVFARGTIET